MTELEQVIWWLAGKDCPAGAEQAVSGTATSVAPQGSGPAAGFEAEPAAAEVELVAAVGSEMVTAAVAAAGTAGDGWLCGGAGTGGAGTAAGDEWQSAAESPPASAGESAAAAGSRSVAESVYTWLYKHRTRERESTKVSNSTAGNKKKKGKQPPHWFELLCSKTTDS